MSQLKAYHRPSDIGEALRLMAREGVNTSLIGGGTYAISHMNEMVEEVVDLQNVGLTDIHHAGNSLTLGAMVRLQSIADDEQMPGLLRQTARQEGPNTLRHVATIGGTVVRANKESEFLAALLVYGTAVKVQTSSGTRRITLPDFLQDVPSALGGGIITAVLLNTARRTAVARVGRTPADKPIVAAIACLGDNNQLRLALCGVANTPVLVNPDNVEAAINPFEDFRGSKDYRRQMAVTLAGRVLKEVTQQEENDNGN